MSDYNYNSNSNSSFDPSWWLIVIAFAIFWPVGVGLLLYKLTRSDQVRSAQRKWMDALDQTGSQGYRPPQERSVAGLNRRSSSSSRPTVGGQPQAAQQQPAPSQQKPGGASRKPGPGKIKDGKGFTIAGTIMTILFGIVTAQTFVEAMPALWVALQSAIIPFILTGVGVGLFAFGRHRRRQARRMRQILNMMGKEKVLDIRALADALQTDYGVACEDIQNLIDGGYLGKHAYINKSTGQLVMDGSSVKVEPKPASKADSLDEDAKVLAEIRQANEAISNPEMSRKIARIEECTQHILEYQKKHPEKTSELHTFLDYILPTTLKMLNTYAELDRQGIDGENVSSTKARIETMMDSVVEGCETQLDKLFQGDMMDITSDIAVMENMLSRDGLSGGMKIPSAPELNPEGKQPSLTLDPDGTAAPFPPIPTPEPAPIPTPDPLAQPDPAGYTPTLTLNPDQGGAAVQTAPQEESRS